MRRLVPLFSRVAVNHRTLLPSTGHACLSAGGCTCWQRSGVSPAGNSAVVAAGAPAASMHRLSRVRHCGWLHAMRVFKLAVLHVALG